MTSRIEHLATSVALYPGDCLNVLKTLEPNSVDSCVTDPPYGLSFMGKAWDHGVPGIEYWKAILRVLKPGGHLLAFGGTRTFGRMHVAIEDAGFEVRDMVSWLYGSGFPKSLDVSKAIDKAAGVKGEFGERKPNVHSRGDHVLHEGWRRPWMDDPEAVNNSGREYLPGSNAAREWSGFGTALKPACEPIVLARKPLSESTVAANVLKWGTGALNIDGCRVASGGDDLNGGTYSGDRRLRDCYTSTDTAPGAAPLNRLANGAGEFVAPPGRWPANVIHDGSDEVAAAFPESDGAQGMVRGSEPSETGQNGIYGRYARVASPAVRGDSGSAARFFYTAKADADDRLGSKHPTVKPLDLIQYLARLVTPPRGLVLDPFAGTGTTGEACIREGFRAVLIEREEEYQNDIRRRMKLAMSGPDERKRESIKAKNKDKPMDAGPLFGADVSA